MASMNKRLILSYVLDWVVIVVLAAAGAGLNYVKPLSRPFSLLNLDISYPLVPESVSVATLALAALLAPAVIIALVTVFLVPGARARRRLKRSQWIRIKLWELYMGLTGLALSVALGFFITQGLKTIVAKPRPHFLAVCQPKTDNTSTYVIGGFGQDISIRWTLVSSSICTQSIPYLLNDAFKSFPSGHASFSWSGLLYLTLFFSSKFGIAIPSLPTYPSTIRYPSLQSQTETNPLPLRRLDDAGSLEDASAMESGKDISAIPLYNRAAPPPNYGIILLLVPLGGAAYITSTRYTQFWHFGFDVISGALIGSLTAWASFRWHNLSIRNGRGWAWGARDKDHAFAKGVGETGYIGFDMER